MAGVNFIAGAVEKTGVDEDHALGGGFDARLEINRGAPLLVHDADLDGVGRKFQRVLDPRKQFHRRGHFARGRASWA